MGFLPFIDTYTQNIDIILLQLWSYVLLNNYNIILFCGFIVVIKVLFVN